MACSLQTDQPHNSTTTRNNAKPVAKGENYSKDGNAHTKCRQVEVREEAARALALFASKRDSQAHLVRSGVIPKLVSFVRSSDPGVRRYGVLGLGNLAVVTQNHQTLFEAGGVSSLLMESVYAAEDIETRRCVAFALNNITSFEPNHRACERAGVLRPLVRLLKDPDANTHLQAAFAIRQLSVTARCRSQLVEMKGLPPLLRQVGGEKVHVCGCEGGEMSSLRHEGSLKEDPFERCC